MRKLKDHEKKLLRKVNFYGGWKDDENHREVKVMRRYHLQNRDDYEKYNKVCGLITSLINKLKLLDASDPFRIKISEQIMEKLYNMGLINSRENVTSAEKIAVSAFCRRRLPVVIQRLKFAETLKVAVTFIEQGHVRIGTEVASDPALLVTRTQEDNIQWVETAKPYKSIQEHKDQFDDYDLLN